MPPRLPLNINQLATKKMQTPPPNWNFESDEELVRFLSQLTNATETFHGNAKKYIDKIEVSTVSLSIIFILMWRFAVLQTDFKVTEQYCNHMSQNDLFAFAWPHHHELCNDFNE